VNCSTASGTITIDGHPGNNFAWCCVNLDDLWDDVSLRGDDLIVPDADGGVPGIRRMNIQQVTLLFAIDGAYVTGGPAPCPATDFEEQLFRNVRLLRKLTSSATAVTSDSTRTVVYTDPTGATWTDAAHVTGPQKQERSAHVGLYRVEVEFTGGALVGA
jgi:hypothetical protein